LKKSPSSTIKVIYNATPLYPDSLSNHGNEPAAWKTNVDILFGADPAFPPSSQPPDQNTLFLLPTYTALPCGLLIPLIDESFDKES